MRIIAGTAGRTSIKVPRDITRPTTDLVRQAIFSILGELVIDAHVADLFAGSGALGLEALSRGAASATFIDDASYSIKTIEQNITATKLSNARVIKSNVLTWLKHEISIYSLIFADPPYVKKEGQIDHIEKIFASGLLLPRLTDNGLFYTEVSKSTPATVHKDWKLLDRRSYGNSAILLYQKSILE
jgi:16S rRNA (guanine966-N2)-methyltransferase